MYLPPQFSARDRSHAVQLMRSHPFASLISHDDDGLPFITHLPLHLEARGDQLVLLGHCAKPNPHWRYLQARPQAVVTFMGPHAYMSPKVYPDLARVPTWNYLAVHCTVQATLIEDPASKDALLKKLIGDHEPPYADQWRGLGDDFAHKMLAGLLACRVTMALDQEPGAFVIRPHIRLLQTALRRPDLEIPIVPSGHCFLGKPTGYVGNTARKVSLSGCCIQACKSSLSGQWPFFVE